MAPGWSNDVSARPVGEPALAAFRRALLAEDGLLGQAESGDAAALTRLRTVNRVIAGSPALLAREQQTMSRTEAALAGLLAAETGADAGDIRPQVAANALLGLHRALIGYVRGRVLAGDDPSGLAAEVRELAAEGFTVLEQGLGDFAAKPPSTDGPPDPASPAGPR